MSVIDSLSNSVKGVPFLFCHCIFETHGESRVNELSFNYLSKQLAEKPLKVNFVATCYLIFFQGYGLSLGKNMIENKLFVRTKI